MLFTVAFPLASPYGMRTCTGKSTTMRMILGFDRPTAGLVTVNGEPFAGLFSAMREVGALLDARAVRSGAATCSAWRRATRSRTAG
jgi:ABC-type uncharacterized transport system ATPase subunit